MVNEENSCHAIIITELPERDRVETRYNAERRPYNTTEGTLTYPIPTSWMNLRLPELRYPAVTPCGIARYDQVIG